MTSFQLYHSHYHRHYRRASNSIELDENRNSNTFIVDINSHVALFQEMLLHVGQPKDCPELRVKIFKLRRICVEVCKQTSQIIMPQMKSSIGDGMSTDNPQLVLLFYLSQLFLRELVKSYRFTQVAPMNMSNYYENRAGPSNLGNVISQILLCKQITPDFNQEKLCSISKDSQEIALLLTELQAYMSKHDIYLEQSAELDYTNNNGPLKQHQHLIYKNMSFLCCMSRQN